jgi:hypothetical protein
LIRPICGFDATFYFLEEDLEKYKNMAGRVEAAAADEKAACGRQMVPAKASLPASRPFEGMYWRPGGPFSASSHI